MGSTVKRPIASVISQPADQTGLKISRSADVKIAPRADDDPPPSS